MRTGFLAARGKAQPLAALRLQFSDEPSALGGDEGPRARSGESGGDIDGGALGTSGFELGNDLQNAGARQRPLAEREGRDCPGILIHRRSSGEKPPDAGRPLPRIHDECVPHCGTMAVALYGPVNGS